MISLLSSFWSSTSTTTNTSGLPQHALDILTPGRAAAARAISRALPGPAVITTYALMGPPLLILSVSPLLTLSADVRPRHSCEACLRDWLFANFAHSECAVSDPNQRLFDRSRKTTVGLVQANLQLCFSVSACLIQDISLHNPCPRDHCADVRACCLQLLELFREELLVFPQFLGLHVGLPGKESRSPRILHPQGSRVRSGQSER